MESSKNNFPGKEALSGLNLSRREWIARMGMVPFATMMSSDLFAKRAASTILPAKDLFAVKDTYINAAFTHPMSIATAKAASGYIKRRLDCDPAADEDMNASREEVKKLFAT